MLLEWGRFVTAVKLNRGLKESNYDQMYAYLKQHEVYANENKIMLERFTQHTVDPLALMSNVSPQHYFSQLSTTPPSTHAPLVTHQPHFTDNTQLDSGLSPTDNLIENLTNNLPYTPNHTKLTFLKLTINSELHQIQGTKPQFKTAGLLFRMFRVDRTEENGAVLDEEKLLFIVGGQDNVVDKDVDEPPVQNSALNVDNVFQADDCDAFDSDVDEASTTQTMFMENLSSAYPIYDEAISSYDSEILSEYVKENADLVVQNNVSYVPNDVLNARS
nr:integrase, catalytic region, zinc finger, CCHC-type, peptidase aspartic, catalytic [Tanacetum cinerariifolium]